jgi:hypothetical protein
VRHLTSAPIPASSEPPPPIPDFWVEKPSPLPVASGLNRTNWNLRYDSPPAFNHSYAINANPGQTPASPEGPLVLPGVYTLTLTVEGKSYTQTVTVKNDPRSPSSIGDLQVQHDLQMKLYHCTREAWEYYRQIADARSSIASLLKANPPSEVETAARAFDGKLAAIGGTTGFGRRFGGGGPPGAGAPPRQPTFTAVNSTAVRQLTTLDSGDMAPTESMQKACTAACSELQTVMKSWDTLKSKELPVFNALLAKNNLKPIGETLAVVSPTPEARHRP